MSDGPSHRARRTSVARQTADRLRAELSSGRWDAGEKLPSETALADEFGVGRSSAREAVQTLAREGLVDVRHGTGIFATGHVGAPQAPTVHDLLRRARIIEVYEVRRGLEVEAARLAALRATPADLARIDPLLRSRQELVGADTATFVDADLAFHRAVVALARNSLLSTLFDEMHAPLRTAIIALVDGEPDLPDTSGDHAALLDAIRAGDPDRAVRATVEHLDTVTAMLRGTTDRRRSE